MTLVALRGLATRKLRAVLTALAIVLGVAMVSGSYVLTDSIQSAFHTIFTSSYDNTDAVVSGKKLVDYSSSGNATVSTALLERVRRAPGVADASGVIMDLGGGVTTAKLYDKHGKLIEGSGNPTFGFGIDPRAERFNPLRLTAGTWATGPHQVVIDKNTADKYGFAVGDRIRASADAGTFPFRVSGIARYGNVDTLGGATFAVFDVPTAQRLLKMGNAFTAISVAAKDGVSPEQLVERLRPLVPGTAVVRTGEQQAQKDERDIAFFVKYIRYFLLAFGFIALFVGGFVIFNTLSITVAQRTRELATLRTLGASRRQVLRSVVLEAFVIGLSASVVGLLAGIGLAKGLSALFSALDLALPEAGQPVEPRTILVSLLVGTVLTVIAGLIPAVRATRVAPVLAVREGSTAAAQKLSRVAPIVATVLGAIAAALLLYGFYAKGVPVGRRILSLVLGTLVDVRRARGDLLAARAPDRLADRQAVLARRALGRRARRVQRAPEPGAHRVDGGGADDRDHARHVRVALRPRAPVVRRERDPQAGEGRLRRHVAERVGRLPRRRRERRADGAGGRAGLARLRRPRPRRRRERDRQRRRPAPDRVALPLRVEAGV